MEYPISSAPSVRSSRRRPSASRSVARRSGFAPSGFTPSGFTLIEVLVSLAIFALMMAIIFVPLRLGINSFANGNTRAQVQAASNQTAAKIEGELRTAAFVFPNDSIAGISNRAPYSNIARAASGSDPAVTYALPYLRQLKTGTGACNANDETSVVPVANLGRLDFVPAKRDDNGNIIIPVRPADYVVTYYARRVDPSKPFDVSDNPVVFFRAQTPFKFLDQSDSQEKAATLGNFPATTKPGDTMFNSAATTALNLNTSETRYPDFSSGSSTVCSGGTATDTNRGSRWLIQNTGNEPDLEGLAKADPDTNAATSASIVTGSHTLLTPRGMEVVSPRAGLPTPDYTPTSTFTCEDTDGNGTIDRVTMRLFLASTTNEGVAANGQPQVQSQGLPIIIDLPNAR